VGVAVKRSLGVAVLGLIAGEVPDDQGFVSGGRQEHVGAGKRLVECPRGKAYLWFLDVLLHGGSQAGDPAILLKVSLHSVFSIIKISFHDTDCKHLVLKRVVTSDSRDAAVGNDRIKVDGGFDVRGPRECP
jgi:hypothetical protein